MKTSRLGALAGVIGIWLAGTATACPTIPEGDRIKYADAVIDGVATCKPDKGTCELRPTEILKDIISFGDGPNIYDLRFEPGAVQSLAESGDILMFCVLPWEPTETRVKGRFYLSRRNGVWWVREGPQPPVQ